MRGCEQWGRPACLQRRFGETPAWSLRSSFRVQECVAIKLESISVKLIRAALQSFVNNGSRVAAELRIERAGDDIYFRQGIGIYRDAGLIQENIVDVCAV